MQFNNSHYHDIQSKLWKIRTKKTSNTDTFHAVGTYHFELPVCFLKIFNIA